MTYLKNKQLRKQNLINLLICKVIELNSQYNHIKMNKNNIFHNNQYKMKAFFQKEKLIQIINNI